MGGPGPGLTAEMVVDAAVSFSPVVSPDGRWICHAVTTIGRREGHPVSALWVAATDGSSPVARYRTGSEMARRRSACRQKPRATTLRSCR